MASYLPEACDFIQMLTASILYAVGPGLVIILFAGVHERILLARPLQEASIASITAGILSLTFMAFRAWYRREIIVKRLATASSSAP